jgi:uncharacterized membrane protein YgcG
MLVAHSGDVAQAATGAGLSVSGSLEAYASGGVALAGAGNQVARLAGGAAGGDFALATGGALAVGGGIAGETVVLRAGGALTLDGASFTAGRAVLLAAPAGIAAGVGSTLDPLDPARLPVLILDSRAAALSAIPDFVQPDLPGLAAAAQPTQLAQFGPAGTAPAGSVAFEVAAGAAPVFLLLDAAPALGALEAGRLGVLGVGGTAFLVGALGGVGGEPAAALASIAGAPASYRFNNCPMGVANCGALPPIDGGGGGGTGGGTGGGIDVGGGAAGGGAAGGVLPPILPPEFLPPAPPTGFVPELLLPVPLLLGELTQPPGGAPPAPGTAAPWSPALPGTGPFGPLVAPIAEEREAEPPR